MPFMNLLTSPSTVVSASDWSEVLSALTSQISVSSVVGVIAAVISAGIGLVFMWWGVRKLIRAVMSAFSKGKLRV